MFPGVYLRYLPHFLWQRMLTLCVSIVANAPENYLLKIKHKRIKNKIYYNTLNFTEYLLFIYFLFLLLFTYFYHQIIIAQY